MLPQIGNGISQSFPSDFPFDSSSLNGLDAAQAKKQMQMLAAVGQARQLAQMQRPVMEGRNSGFSPASNQPPHEQNQPPAPLSEPPMLQNARNANVYKERAHGFIVSIASLFAKRNQPLPPALTGIPAPNYDSLTSPFKDIEPGSEPGFFRLAAKEINMFQLWTMVWQRGGMANLGKDNSWQLILQALDLPESALSPLVQIYKKTLLPFEHMYRQNIMEKSKQQAAANGQQPTTPQRSLAPPSLPSSGQDGVSSILDAPNLDQDLLSLKRKLEQEEEGKRSRQKTETVDNVFPAGSPSDQAFVGPSTSTNSGPTSTPAMTAPPRTRQEVPSRRKIEYRPLARDVDSYGGRDLKAIETEFLNSTRRPLRELNEWGHIDIDALTLSIRSRLSTELSYALATLTLLSTMKGQQPSSGFPISNCPDLLEEILDLVEDLAFGDVEDVHETINLEDDPRIVTNHDLVDIVYELGSQPFAGLEHRQGSKDVDVGPRQRPANLILTVTNIIRNLSVFTDNVPFLANQPRLLDLLLRICGISEKDSSLNPTSAVLSTTDLLAVRKDVLYTLCQLAPAIHFIEGTTPVSTVRRIFYLIASYLVDPAEAISPVACVQLVGIPLSGSLKPPSSIADIALEVFTRICQADGTRLFFSKTVCRPSLWRLFHALVHRLPVAELDFALTLRSEPWMSYVEKLILALYSLAFIFTPEYKAKVKADRRLGFKSVMIRIIQKLFVQIHPDGRQTHTIVVRRVIETLKLIDDEEDSFDNTKGVVTTLSFGMGYGEVGDNEAEKGTGLLGCYRDIGWDILLCREISNDEVMFPELESLLRVDF
ncbi:hypothetical protein BT96DRAFT_983617 [Gymnopus androsaceus JB14]|uniref:ARID domain-containing protein n=1 Tax=Gymnopus androsaceus JB14 TaxID=1447944 RepID=A0A6A4ISE9_9AGAR|nr:hypothetical protein BT96DRAFT_983617 [Gymnopus androsaceus JB14]